MDSLLTTILEEYYPIYAKWADKVLKKHSDLWATHVDKINYVVDITYTTSTHNTIFYSFLALLSIYYLYYEEFMFRIMCIFMALFYIVVLIESIVFYCSYSKVKSITDNFKNYVANRDRTINVYAHYAFFIEAMVPTAIILFLHYSCMLADAAIEIVNGPSVMPARDDVQNLATLMSNNDIATAVQNIQPPSNNGATA